MRLAKHRRQIGISLPTLPYYASVGLATRLYQLTGAFVRSSIHTDTAGP